MSYTAASDLELINALRKGSRSALTEIFHRHWKSLFLTAAHKLQSRAIAEELVQDLFADIWEKRERLFSDEDVNLSGYLQRAIKNRVLNQLRKQLHDRKYWTYCRYHLPVSQACTQDHVEFNDLQEKLNFAIEELSDKTKEIFVMHKIKGIPVVKISEQLKLSEKAVGYHLTKSVKELKIRLRDFI